MRNSKHAEPTAAAAAPERFAGDRADREIEILPPFNLQGEDGAILSHGNRYTVSADFADRLINSGRAFDSRTGERQNVSKAELPEVPQRSGKTVRVRIRRGFSIQGDGGTILEEGSEHEIPIEMLRIIGDRADRVDVEQLPARKPVPTGEPHLIRIVGASSGPGTGIYCLALDRHVEFGEEVTVPDSEAVILIAIGRAVSLRPEMPDPALEEFAELLGGGDKRKQARVATLAQRLLRRNS